MIFSKLGRHWGGEHWVDSALALCYNKAKAGGK